jgi:hypothetical protein
VVVAEQVDIEVVQLHLILRCHTQLLWGVVVLAVQMGLIQFLTPLPQRAVVEAQALQVQQTQVALVVVETTTHPNLALAQRETPHLQAQVKEITAAMVLFLLAHTITVAVAVAHPQ